MSAKNIILGFPFKKMSGQVVWRVMKVDVSEVDYAKCYKMSTKVYQRDFLEYAGSNAWQRANDVATLLERYLTICEYGIEIAHRKQKPITMKTLREELIEQEYDAYDLWEASDTMLNHLPMSDWLSRFLNSNKKC